MGKVESDVNVVGCFLICNKTAVNEHRLMEVSTKFV